jgi:hypothetical protein
LAPEIDLAGGIASAVRAALRACAVLEHEVGLPAPLRFRGDELRLEIQDRLVAPNTPETLARFGPALDDLVTRLHPGRRCSRIREGHPRGCFTVRITAPESPDVDTLLGRLG